MFMGVRNIIELTTRLKLTDHRNCGFREVKKQYCYLLDRHEMIEIYCCKTLQCVEN
jgi:hypothetical protein